MKLAVIGDIHANAEALSAALVETQRAGYDLRIIMGDILTYGVEIRRTLELVAAATSEQSTVLIFGNHDEIYRRMIENGATDASNGESWVHQHIRWTKPQVPVDLWRDLPFVDSLDLAHLHFSHANPFGKGDWTYLNNATVKARAARVLCAQGVRLGIFAHTHRPDCFAIHPSVQQGEELGCESEERTAFGDFTYVLNAGSVGQPRCRLLREMILWLQVDTSQASFRFQPLRYDIEAHTASIVQSSLPEGLKERCLSYF